MSFRKVALVLWLLSFVYLNISDNTVDTDLWGHVLFGQRMLAIGDLEPMEPFSWTAQDHPWVNHEVLAEVVMGLAHQLGGGSGLLLLKLFVSGMACWLAYLWSDSKHLSDHFFYVRLIVTALASTEMYFGLAVRPQLFTLLALPLLLKLIGELSKGHKRWLWAMPVLFALWVNTHGGVLAGLALLGLSAGLHGLQWLVDGRHAEGRSGVVTLFVGLTSAAVGCMINPWGVLLPVWIAESVLWSRTPISEWQGMPLDTHHLAFYGLVLLVFFAVVGSKLSRPWWRWGVLIVLMLVSIRTSRHAPLFALACIQLLPAILESAFRERDLVKRLGGLFQSKLVQGGFLTLIVAMTLTNLAMATIWRSERFWTIEIPRDTYPVAATEFMQASGIQGRLINYFDWGEMLLWELPQSPVSIDGRLDTCYPVELCAAHWAFYNGDIHALPFKDADILMLPANLPIIDDFLRDPRWHLAYGDPLASVWVRSNGPWGARATVFGSDDSVLGRVPFPDEPPARAELREILEPSS